MMRRPKSCLTFVFCLLVSASCSTKELRIQEYRISPDAPDPAKPPEEFYVIGPGDGINVQVWKEPTLSGSVTVRPDGYVTLPLLNEVQIAGLTTGQLRKLLEQKYKEFTTDPFVTISVGGISSAEVFLIGESVADLER
jgi:protein involved in polysaccharide export with SLBB domain